MNDRVTIHTLARLKKKKTPITVVTCYDFAFAKLLDGTEIEVLLVGDSMGNTMLGFENTLPVSMEHIIHHTAAVSLGAKRALIMADMPFMSYQASDEEAVRNAGRLVKEGAAQVIKLEGGKEMTSRVRAIVNAGIPVFGHLGLTPQSVNAFGGFKVQGRTSDQRIKLLSDADALVESGVCGMVLELIPADLAQEVTERVTVPTIGIGAGPFCDGQVQVMHDLFGLFPDQSLKHSRKYIDLATLIQTAIGEYISDVRSRTFPSKDNSY